MTDLKSYADFRFPVLPAAKLLDSFLAKQYCSVSQKQTPTQYRIGGDVFLSKNYQQKLVIGFVA